MEGCEGGVHSGHSKFDWAESLFAFLGLGRDDMMGTAASSQYDLSALAL